MMTNESANQIPPTLTTSKHAHLQFNQFVIAKAASQSQYVEFRVISNNHAVNFLISILEYMVP
jgi:hypothetical protein